MTLSQAEQFRWPRSGIDIVGTETSATRILQFSHHFVVAHLQTVTVSVFVWEEAAFSETAACGELWKIFGCASLHLDLHIFLGAYMIEFKFWNICAYQPVSYLSPALPSSRGEEQNPRAVLTSGSRKVLSGVGLISQPCRCQRLKRAVARLLGQSIMNAH